METIVQNNKKKLEDNLERFKNEHDAAVWVYNLMVASDTTEKASKEVSVKDIEEILGYDFNFNFHQFS